MNVFKRILLTGTSSSNNLNEARLAKTINIFSFIILVCLVIGFVNFIFLRYEYPWQAEIVFFTLSLFTIWLNYQGKFRAAVWAFLINVNASIFYISEFYEHSTGSYLFYFPVILAVALMHIPGEGVWRTMQYYVFTIGVFLVSLVYNFSFIPTKINTPQENAFILMFNLGFSVAICAIEIIMIINLINGQNRELLSHLETEKNLHASSTKNLREKEVLLSELHHRVKNNMAIISSLLNLQMGATDNEELKQALRESRSRVISMSLIHERLYRKNDLSNIDMDQYLADLMKELLGSGTHYPIALKTDLQPLILDISLAIPVGLIVNELVTNSIKHAFPQQKPDARISVLLVVNENTVTITVADNGIGYAVNKVSQKDGGLGLSLIDSLTEQLDGKMYSETNSGTRTTIEFTVQSAKQA